MSTGVHIDETHATADTHRAVWAMGDYARMAEEVMAPLGPLLIDTTAADELVRVCRPGGTIAVISWTYEGFFGQMLTTLRPYRPTLTPGVPPAPLWGREDYVRGLLGDGVAGVETQRGILKVARFNSPEAVHEYFKNHYGPTINAYRNIGDNQVLAAALDTQLIELARRHFAGGVMEWEYLLVTAHKR